MKRSPRRRRRRRTVVGLTVSGAPGRGLLQLREGYVRSLEKAGGLPVLLAPGGPDDAAEVVGHLDALVLSGGGDVDPALYGEERRAALMRVWPERDAFELALCREALRRDLPLLAICRGLQVLNVATGGTLVQDIPSEWPGAVDHYPDIGRRALAHDVSIRPGTRLRRILGSDTVAVNSFHHQAVKRLGKGLAVSAVSSRDGIVEGIEAPARRFAVGVQWHPEIFWARPPDFRALFEAVVEAGRVR